MPKRLALLILAISVAAAGTLWAQGVQTSSINGVVTTPDGQRLPGATVTATSPALLGSRTTTSDSYGAYILRGLPPGAYTVSFEKAGMTTVQQKRTVELGKEYQISATLAIAARQEDITVTASAEAVVTNTQAGANYSGETVDTLAMGRTLAAIAELAPGLTDNTPNTGQITIAGSFGYDNTFLVDGVDVNDNLFGNANALYIEDAIDETQVLTSGISAEYGRFSGGVINAVTKRGGNAFSGSFRADLSNPAWVGLTPYEKSNDQKHTDKLSSIYQATLGGYVVKDRLWFFTAGRRQRSTTTETLLESARSYDLGTENDRYEAKLTGNINPKHTLQATYMNVLTLEKNRPSLSAQYAADPRTLIDREIPNSLFSANYLGVLRSNLTLEARFSRKAFQFKKAGGTSTSITDSPFLTAGALGPPASRHYNAPFFDANDPEDRNNRQLAGALSYFLSTPRFGRHDFKAGFERFTSTNTGGNSQSATGYVFWTDYKTDAAGKPVFDSQDRMIPIFMPGLTEVWTYRAERGAQLDITTLGIFANDNWTLNKHWSFNLGLRYEKATGKSSSGINTADASALVPRLGVSFDPKGDGKSTLQATYAIYSGRFNDNQFARITNVGNPSEVDFQYDGPYGEGVGFAPGFDLSNYPFVTYGDFPTRNVSFDNLSSPKTREFTIQAGRAFGHGYVKAVYVNRKMSNFIEDFIELKNGTTTVSEVINDEEVEFGTFDNKVFRNTDVPKRDYQGLTLQGRLDLLRNWSIEGHYTLQLKNDGNFEGEAANQPGNPSTFADYPELLTEARNYPVGHLDDFQRHKLRLFTYYRFNLKRLGSVTPSLLWRYDSGLTYSLAATGVKLSNTQKALGAGYAVLPSSQTLYFGDRGSQFFKGYQLVDFAATYDIPIWKRVRPYVKFELRNIGVRDDFNNLIFAFNSDKQIAWTRTVTPDAKSAVDNLGLATGYTKSSSFGKAASTSHYPAATEHRFALGFRF